MISVIIPAYNCEQYIGQAIDSALGQTVDEELEIIVVDDASKDGTKEAVRGKNPNGKGRTIRCHVNDCNLGAAESRNIGIRMAAGEYIAFLDADDI